jgi:hypothetical protein
MWGRAAGDRVGRERAARREEGPAAPVIDVVS